jgi:hypothetical protein
MTEARKLYHVHKNGSALGYPRSVHRPYLAALSVAADCKEGDRLVVMLDRELVATYRVAEKNLSGRIVLDCTYLSRIE